MKWTNCPKESVTDIAYNGVDTFLAVGPEGKVFYSNDGKNWTLYASNIFGIGNTGGTKSIIAYNGVDTWVVGGGLEDGSGNINGYNLAYSNDGKKWTPVTNIGSVSSIVYNGVDTWVAVGSSICYSKDGKKWTQVPNIEGQYDQLAYNGVNTWISVGRVNNRSVVAHSKDGQLWNTVNTNIISGYDVAYNGVDTWVVVGMGDDDLSSIIYSNDNGKNWNKGKINISTSGVIEYPNIVMSVAYNGVDTWVAVGGNNKIPTTLYSKDDCLTWNKGTDIFSGGSASCVAYNGVDTWVAFGIVNNRSVVAYSKDGIIWTMGTGIDVQMSYENLGLKIFTLK
jgi:hypothetical protein